MWKKIQNTDFYLKFNENLEILITDYNTIWSTYFSTTSFLTCLKDSNFGLEIEEEDFIVKGKQMLQNPDQLKSIRVKKDETMLIVSMMVSFGYPLKLEFKLTEGSKEFFFQNITQQLLKTIHDLKTSQNELRHLLLKKDQEIHEYKCEGGEIALRHLKTKVYNDEAHMCKHTAYNANFGSCDIPDHLLDENHAVKEEPKQATPLLKHIPGDVIVPVKHEPDNNIKKETIKVEPQSLSQQNMVGPRKKQKIKINL